MDKKPSFLVSSQLFYCLLVAGSVLAQCPLDDPSCLLPDCYCRYKDIPGNVTAADTPQMILFTYTGAITTRTKQILADVFPDHLRNPNECPIGVTLFVVSQGSVDCEVHRMYYRGHEIALAGLNRTGWLPVDWRQQIDRQMSHLVAMSDVDLDSIVGVRAQKSRPGGNRQFDVLRNNMFLYDSSMLAGPRLVLDDQHPYLWPFTLNNGLSNISLSCLNPTCPSASYDGLWEIPVSSMIGTRLGKPRACTFLDDCISSFKSGQDVSNMLKKHLAHCYQGNRAPFQVNLQPRSLEMRIIVDGLKDFVRYAMARSDMWIVTSHEAIKWIQQPLAQTDILAAGIWDCPDRSDLARCRIASNSSTVVTFGSFRTILAVDDICVWQTIALVILAVIICRYNKERTKHNARKT